LKEIITMKKADLEEMWEVFSNTPINNNDEIETDFYWWEKGTYRFDIWNWFDEELKDGIAEYIFSRKTP
jgi:hypothetical protein